MNSKHANGTPRCPLCEDKLAQAHPDLVEWFRTRVKPNFPQIHISCSWRGKDEQDSSYRAGKSMRLFPHSMHNKIDAEGHPCSMAIDLFELLDGRATFPITTYHRIQEIIDKYDDPIFWGGRWEKLGDFCHFQLELSGASEPVIHKDAA